MKTCPHCHHRYPDTVVHCPRDRTSLKTAKDPYRKDRFSGYRLLDFLQEGGMGWLYLAEQMELQRSVAIKILRPQFSAQLEFKARFRAEARAIARLKHPHIVDVIDLGESVEGNLYLVLELLSGEDLHSRLRRGPLSLDQILGISEQMLSALAFAHRHSVIHRDLKPGNVFLAKMGGRSDWVKLLDFGIAKIQGLTSSFLTVAGSIMGTPGHMAPEQILGEPTDHRCDVYALGTVLYQMCCGAPPFGRGDPATIQQCQLDEAFPALPIDPDRHIDEKVAEVVSRCLRVDPAQRYATVEDLARALGEAFAVELHLGEATEETSVPTRSTAEETSAELDRGTEQPCAASASDPSLIPTNEFDREIRGDFLSSTIPKLPLTKGTVVDQEQRAQVLARRRILVGHRRILSLAVLLGGLTASVGWLFWPRGPRPPLSSFSNAPPTKKKQPLPSDEGTIALQVLRSTMRRDNTLELRLAALQIAGRLGRIDLSLEVAKELDDEDLAVRCAAVEAVGRIGDPRHRDRLLMLRRSGASLLAAFVDEALWRLGEAEALTRLQGFIRDPDQATRVKAMNVLAALGHASAAAALSDEARRSHRADLALIAIRYRSQQGHPEDRAQLHKLLQSGDPALRTRVARWLVEQGEEEAVEKLRRWVVERDPMLRLEAASALAQLGLSDGVSVLLDEARGVNAVAALGALALLDAPERLNIAIAGLRSVDPRIRIAAAEVVLRHQLSQQKTSHLDWVQFALGSPESPTRAAAVDVLSLISPKQAIPLLSRALRDKVPEVRRRAATVLGKTHVEEAVPLLGHSARDEAVAVREAAVRALGENGISSAIPFLRSALSAAGPVGVWAAGSLFKLGLDEGMAELRRALEVPDLREIAIQAMGETLSPRVIPDLKKMLGQDRLPLRQAAAIALAHLGDASGVDELKKALALEARFKAPALVALGRLGHVDSESRRMLKQMASADDPTLRRIALRSAVDARSSNVLSLLERGLSDAQVEVRREAVLLLGRAPPGDGAIRSRLLRLALADPDAAVRAVAGLLLSAPPRMPSQNSTPARQNRATGSGEQEEATGHRQALVARTTGEVLVVQGRFAEALAAFLRARRLDPRIELDFELGDLYRRRALSGIGQSRRKDLQRAERHYRRVLAKEQKSPRARRAEQLLEEILRQLQN